MRKLQKGPNTARGKEAKTSVPMLEQSKRIKKEKKQHNIPGIHIGKLKDFSKEKKTQQINTNDQKAANNNAAADLEEGEEGMIISEAENSHMSNSSDSDAGVNPTEKKLIEKYEKYPEYLKVTFNKPDSFFDNLMPFNNANRAAITNILSAKNKELISEQSFPFALYIQLVPELNVLTISAATGADNDLLSTDALMTDLISLTDQGN